MSTPRLVLAFLTLFSLTACSGSGGRASSGSDARNLDLFVNTGTGSDVRITGRLSVVALEAADGTLTGDLLPGDPEIVLSDPVPELVGLRLDDAAPGTYVAANLAFASQELIGVLPDQTQVVITIPQRDFRLPLNRPLVITSGPQSWFTMHHVGPIQLVPAGSGFTWTPTWVAEAAEVELVRGARVRVEAFSAQRFTVDGRLLGCGDRRVVVDLSRADSLVRDAAEITREGFFAALQVGEVMVVEGWLGKVDKERHILAIAAAIDDESRPKSKVRGEIVDVSAERSAVGLLVTRVLKDNANLPVTRPLQLTVLVDESTRIKWLPRLGRHRGHLPFSALQPGMVVDVEWFGPAPGLELTARKVDIRSRARSDVPGVVIAEVDAVDVEGGTFTVSGRGPFPLRLGARRFETLVVVVDEGSFMVRHDDGGRHTRIGLDALPVGGRVLMVVEPIEGDRVRALLVHVR